MSETKPITADTTIEEIVNDYPELVRPLMEYGIKCVVCGEPIWGTLQENADEKGVERLPEIVSELNRIVAEKHENYRGKASDADFPGRNDIVVDGSKEEKE